MITRRFRAIIWVGWVAVAATGSYLVTLRGASTHKRLLEVNAKIDSAQRDIRALNTELSARANVRQLERWNDNPALALSAPRASQYLPDADALSRFDPKALKGDTAQPLAAMAAVTSTNAAPPTPSATARGVKAKATLAQVGKGSQPAAARTKVVMLDAAIDQALRRPSKP